MSACAVETIYEGEVWPALAKLLYLADATPVPVGQLIQALTRALAQLVVRSATSSEAMQILQEDPLAFLRSLTNVSRLLLVADPRSANGIEANKRRRLEAVSGELEGEASRNAQTAADVEQLFHAACSAIQLLVVPDASGQRWPLGITKASVALAAGVYGLRYLIPTSSLTAELRAEMEAALQQLNFTLLFCYLQQVSSRNPKDLGPLSKLVEDCSPGNGILQSDNTKKNDEPEKVDFAPSTLHSDASSLSAENMEACYKEAAQLWATSGLNATFLQGTVGRTRFRRTALLFKSLVPHMASQAPTGSFLLVHVFLGFADAWKAVVKGIEARNGALVASLLAAEALEYGSDLSDTSETAKAKEEDRLESFLRSWDASAALALHTSAQPNEESPEEKRIASRDELRALYKEKKKMLAAIVGDYGHRLRVVLGVSQAHGALLATALVASLAATAPAASPTSCAEEDAALKLMRAASLLPRHDALSSSEALHKLHTYAPFGQLLAAANVTEFQKPHVFVLLTQKAPLAELFPALSPAQRRSQVMALVLRAWIGGVVDTEMALLLYHFAETRLPPYQKPGEDGTPAPITPCLAMSYYTAAVRQYAEKAHNELVMDAGAISDFSGGSVLGDMGGAVGRGNFRGRGPGARRMDEARRQREVAAAAEAAEAAKKAASALPSSGELKTTRFCRMVYPDLVPPPWQLYLVSPEDASAKAANSGSAETATPNLVTPLLMVLDLLAAGLEESAASLLCWLAAPPQTETAVRSLNVFLVPRHAVAPHRVNVQYYVYTTLRTTLKAWKRQEVEGKEDELEAKVVAKLRHASQLLYQCQTYLASETLIGPLMERLVWLCERQVSKELTLRAPIVFALVEELLLRFLMPCSHVMSASPFFYDALHRIFTAMGRHNSKYNGHYGASRVVPVHFPLWLSMLLPPSAAKQYELPVHSHAHASQDSALLASAKLPYYPHERLRFTELEGLLSQSLKRLNMDNIENYRTLLREVLYAYPLTVAHRLLNQCVGYGNNFLSLHVRLLHGLPSSLLLMMMWQGIQLMYKYAAEDKASGSGESRVALVAAFLAALWRDNCSVGAAQTGAVLVRAAEMALRGDRREDFIFGLELLKALLAEMCHHGLECDEKYNPVQLQALTQTPPVTSFFARGAMTSFRVGRWARESNPMFPVDVLRTARAALLEALQEACDVPVAKEDDDDDEEEQTSGAHPEKKSMMRRLSLGQHIIIHIARLQQRIYKLQSDMDGAVEVTLLSSAKLFNTMTDMMNLIEEDLPAVSSRDELLALEQEVRQVGMPHTCYSLSQRFRVKLAAKETVLAQSLVGPSGEALYHGPFSPASHEILSLPFADASATQSEALPPALQQQLWSLSAAHFVFEEAPYKEALDEVFTCMRKAASLITSDTISVETTPLGVWLANQNVAIRREKKMHERLYHASADVRERFRGAMRDYLVGSEKDADVEERLVALVTAHLIPRALASLREAAAVSAFFQFLFRPDTSDAVGGGVPIETVLSLAMTFLTAVATYFVSYTDAECKRLGIVVQQIFSTAYLSESGMAMVTPTSAAVKEMLEGVGKPSQTGSGKAAAAGTAPTEAAVKANSCMAAAAFASTYLGQEEQQTSLLKLIGRHISPIHTSKPAESAGADAAQDSMKAAVETLVATQRACALQAEAFVLRMCYQLFTHETDVPAHVHRNAFIFLEQLLQKNGLFPSTPCSADLLQRIVELHAVETKPYFALATATLKTLREVRRRQRAVEQCLAAPQDRMEALLLAHHKDPLYTAEKVCEEVQAYYYTWRLREQYMTHLLEHEMYDWSCTRGGLRPLNSDDSDEEKEEKAEDVEKEGDEKKDASDADNSVDDEEEEDDEEDDDNESSSSGSEGSRSGSDDDSDHDGDGGSGSDHGDSDHE